MTEISSHKMVVYKYDNNNSNKISSTIPSKLYKTNRTLAFNDSNNIKTNSSLFTNEFLIKSIVNNNTSPYNSFYPKKKQYSKKLIFWEDKYHKKTIKNKLLLTNNSSINFNGTKSYLSRFINEGVNEYNKTSLFKNLKEKSDFISTKGLNFNVNTETNENFITTVEKDNIQKKKKMKLLKIKINRLLKENSLNLCDTFEKRNNSFNIKLKNYFNSEKYIKGKEIEKANLNQNKKGFSSSHNLLDFYYEPQIDKKTNQELMACSLINNLSNEEKKIISINPKYFLIDKKKILIKKLNIVIEESLKDRIKREEKAFTENKISNLKEEIKTDTNNNFNFKKIFNKKLRKKFKIYNEKKINNKMIEYHHNISIKDIAKNRLIDYVNAGINDYYKKFYSFCHKNYLKYNQFKEGDYYYKMFNYPLNFKMTREYYLTKNDQRLQKEGLFHLLQKQKTAKTESIIKKIKSCQDIMKNNYNKK